VTEVGTDGGATGRNIEVCMSDGGSAFHWNRPLFSRSTLDDHVHVLHVPSLLEFFPTIPPGLVSARGYPSGTQLLSPQSFSRHLATAFIPLQYGHAVVCTVCLVPY
jgi:hypothetical protein